MSTKTLRKRIALVAVSALGAGLLSVVAVPSANAAVAANTYNWGSAAGSVYSAGSLGVCSYSSSTNSLVTLATVGGSTIMAPDATTAAVTTASYTLTAVTGSGYFNVSAATTDTDTFVTLAVNNAKTAVTLTADTGDTYVPATIAWVPAGVGKATFALTETVTATGATTTLDTYTLTVVAACDGTYAAAKSAVQLTTGTIGAGATELTTATGVSDTTDADKPAWNQAAFIALWLTDQYGASVSSTSSYLTATATAGATLSWTENVTSSSQSTAVETSNLHNKVLVVFPNSATYDAVSTTVTITYNGTVVGTKTINFRGDAKSIKVSSIRGAITEGAANSSGVNVTAYYVETLDSAGNRLAVNPALYAGTGKTTGAIASITGSATAAAPVGVACSATSGTGTQVLYYVRTSDGAVVLSPSVALTCSSSTKYNYTVALDKATYLPGESGTLTISVKDSAGQAVSDAAVLGSAASKFAIGGSGITFLNAPLYTDTTDGGKFVYKFYTTLVEGNYVAGVTLSEAVVVTTATANFVVKGSSSSVSNADVLKAIVSLIASINKQIAALQKALLKK